MTYTSIDDLPISPSKEGTPSAYSPADSPSGSLHLAADVPLEVPGGLQIGPADILHGTGTIDGSVRTYGTLSPGNSPGLINIIGDLTIVGSDGDIINDGYAPAGTDM
ncbi:MAG: hypothetical protein IIC50_17520, partial [Planctomycetes bacterium]|nr:hypothetical protein [Planctomycetota bacterium]